MLVNFSREGLSSHLSSVNKKQKLNFSEILVVEIVVISRSRGFQK